MALGRYSELFAKVAQDQTVKPMPRVNIIEDEPEAISSRRTEFEGLDNVVEFTDHMEEEDYTQPLPRFNNQDLAEEEELNSVRDYSISYLNSILTTSEKLLKLDSDYNLSREIDHLVNIIKGAIQDINRDMSLYVIERKYQEVGTAISRIHSIISLYQRDTATMIERQIPYLNEFGDKALKIYRAKRKRELDRLKRFEPWAHQS